MPEAAIDEDHFPASREREVGRSRQPCPVKPEPITQPMGDTAHGKLWKRVALFEGTHHLRALNGRLLHRRAYPARGTGDLALFLWPGEERPGEALSAWPIGGDVEAPKRGAMEFAHHKERPQPWIESDIFSGGVQELVPEKIRAAGVGRRGQVGRIIGALNIERFPEQSLSV